MGWALSTLRQFACVDQDSPEAPLRGRRPDVGVLHMSGVSPRMELPDPSRHLRAEGHSNAR